MSPLISATDLALITQHQVTIEIDVADASGIIMIQERRFKVTLLTRPSGTDDAAWQTKQLEKNQMQATASKVAVMLLKKELLQGQQSQPLNIQIDASGFNNLSNNTLIATHENDEIQKNTKQDYNDLMQYLDNNINDEEGDDQEEELEAKLEVHEETLPDPLSTKPKENAQEKIAKKEGDKVEQKQAEASEATDAAHQNKKAEEEEIEKKEEAEKFEADKKNKETEATDKKNKEEAKEHEAVETIKKQGEEVANETAKNLEKKEAISKTNQKAIRATRRIIAAIPQSVFPKPYHFLISPLNFFATLFKQSPFNFHKYLFPLAPKRLKLLPLSSQKVTPEDQNAKSKALETKIEKPFPINSQPLSPLFYNPSRPSTPKSRLSNYFKNLFYNILEQPSSLSPKGEYRLQDL